MTTPVTVARELYRIAIGTWGIRIIMENGRASVLWRDESGKIQGARFPDTAAGGIEALRFAEELADELRGGRCRHFSRHDADLYVIRCEETRRFKIGISGNVERRFRALQHNSPTKLTLEGVVERVGAEFESRLHDELFRFRLQGEWFQSTPQSEAILKVALCLTASS